MLEKLEFLEKRIGNTPLIKLSSMTNLYVKLESYQLGQSIKVRPALAILKEAIKSGVLKKDSVVIESTSGNFGIALAMCCNLLSLKFIAVIDKNTPAEKKKMLKLLKAEVVLIDKKDSQGAYLLNRLEFVKNYLASNANCFNPNQYLNANNPGSYYKSLAPEICGEMEKLDIVFIAVSTGGTLHGLSKALREHYKDIQIVGVDVKGSQVFADEKIDRKLSGIGSSQKSNFLKESDTDFVDLLTETQVIQGCNDLLNSEMIFAGASTGAAFYAARKYMLENPDKVGLFISPDGGHSYVDKIYNLS
ncbi:cysteine synthase family protein [uncultured Kordia sp.]|uniref:cysteine synthase family protein n=1 Tax=uncultured Kordia sp. TaxID=507699 RepID=UPI002632BBE9|nr:cysteine synthase family protein [uncultured Kordia sp.]